MKKINIGLIISGIFTFLIMGVMNIILIPAIEKTTNGLKYFDMNPLGYTYENAKEFLSLLSQEGRDVCLNIQLPLDFVYPIVYTALFILLMYKLMGGKTWLFVFPCLLFISDYIENTLTIVMLKSQALSKGVATAASMVTIIKSVLMYGIIAFLLVKLVMALVKKKKKA